MYIEKLSITNFRCFEKAELELNYPGRRATKARPVPEHLKNVNLFLGSNGSGKSSVFKALALGVLAPVINSSGFQSDYLVRRRPEENHLNNGEGNSPKRSLTKGSAIVEATLKLDSIDTDLKNLHVKGRTEIRRVGDVEDISATSYTEEDTWERMFLNDSPAFFLAGYGANRRTERPEGYSEQSRSPRYQRVAGLFEDHVGLVPVSYGYIQLASIGYIEEARSILNALLPDGTEILGSDGQQPLFRRDGIVLPFSALSDGFRTFIGWVWDLLLQLARTYTREGNLDTPIDYNSVIVKMLISQRQRFIREHKLIDIPGVVIVDEIDLFLHPEWQRHVIESIAKTFPKIQFCFSTHSPLVAGTLEPENIFVMESDGVEQYQENIHGLTANQVLTSSYFGLSSTRAPGTEMDEITKLALSGKEADRLEFARRMAEAIPSE